MKNLRIEATFLPSGEIEWKHFHFSEKEEKVIQLNIDHRTAKNEIKQNSLSIVRYFFKNEKLVVVYGSKD